MDKRVLTSLSQGPKIIERLLRVFPHDRLDDRIEADRFTAREVVSHLADYEQTVLDRIRAANQTPGRTVPDYDPDVQASLHGFADKEPFHEAEVFESRRGMTLAYLADLSDEDLEKTFQRAGAQPITIRQYLTLLLTHDMEHIEQVSAYLATEVAVHS